MKKNTVGKNFITALIIIGVFCFAGWIASMFDSGPRCIETGCYRRQEPDSDYCYDHELYREESSTDDESSSDDKSSTDSSNDSGSSKKTYNHINNDRNSDSDSSYSNNTRKNTYGTSSSPTISTYDSYDEGYDDIYMDGDYDDNRYDNDSDYADGVDDEWMMTMKIGKGVAESTYKINTFPPKTPLSDSAKILYNKII